MIHGKYWNEPIHPKIIDPTVQNISHNMYAHLGCTILRCTLGLVLIFSTPNKYKWIWLLLCGMVILLFGIKYVRFIYANKVVWKSYLRTITAYTVAAGLIQKNKFDIAGSIIIMDALAGIQSRHTAHVVSYMHT